MAMTTTSCCNCGIEFGVPQHFLDARRADAKDFHCPNGHVLSFAETEADKMRRERDRAKQQIAQRDDEITALRRQVEAEQRKAKRVQKRIHAGVCPCCNRTFQNVARHMATKHPETPAIKVA